MRSESVKSNVIRGMHGHELPLKMGRKLRERQPVARQYSMHFIAICFAFGGALQVKETRIPRGNLYAFVAKLCGPARDVFQVVEWCCVARELGQKDRRSFYRVHARRLPKLDRASYYVLPWSAYVPWPERLPGPCGDSVYRRKKGTTPWGAPSR